jgi:hypothetical protein
MGQDEELMKVAGDLLFKAADFPMAAGRCRAPAPHDPACGFGRWPEPARAGHAAEDEAHGRDDRAPVAALQQAQQGKEQQDTNIKAYDAETRRMAALGQPLDPQVVAHVATQVVMQMMQTGSPQGEPIQAPPDPSQQMPQQPNPPSAGFSFPTQPQ